MLEVSLLLRLFFGWFVSLRVGLVISHEDMIQRALNSLREYVGRRNGGLGVFVNIFCTDPWL